MTWEDFAAEWNDDGREIRCLTSGSTGIPGTIFLPKIQMAASARRTIEYFGITDKSNLHSCISPDFIGGKMVYIRSILSGASFSYEKPSNRPFENYSGPPVSLVSVVPSQLSHILHHISEMPPIEAILVGGSPMHDSLRRKASESPIPVYESYGMTETASHIALRRVEIPQKPFTPLEGISVSSGPGDCLEITIAGWKKVLTNDVARIGNDGSFEIIGRADNVIISGGLKIHPEEIESVLGASFPFPIMITSKPDAIWGEALIMIAETENKNENLIFEICRKTLKKHQIPKKIIFAPIPRTQNGKIKRKIW